MHWSKLSNDWTRDYVRCETTCVGASYLLNVLSIFYLFMFFDSTQWCKTFQTWVYSLLLTFQSVLPNSCWPLVKLVWSGCITQPTPVYKPEPWMIILQKENNLRRWEANKILIKNKIGQSRCTSCQVHCRDSIFGKRAIITGLWWEIIMPSYPLDLSMGYSGIWLVGWRKERLQSRPGVSNSN